MTLRIHLPHEILFTGEVGKIVAEAENGSFCLLPRHVDFATALVPGLLSCYLDEGQETLFAIDEGILVKQEQLVLISTRNAIQGTQIGELRSLVEREFAQISESERKARAALARLETSMARRFVEFQKHG